MANENNNKKLSLNLVVDKHQNRVVFAEADWQFVDILFSFLTLPIGTIIRLLHKQSPLLHMNKLYESVADLDGSFFETAACKSMLLFPRSAAESVWKSLRINVDDLNSPRFYMFRCYTWQCNDRSLVPHGRCQCGAFMTVESTDTWLTGVKGFVEKSKAMRFMVGDDLRVSLVSTAATLSLLEKLGIRDGAVLENRVVELGRDEILSLLKRCMSSTMPLSEVFLGSLPANAEESTQSIVINRTNVKIEDADVDTAIQRMKVKFIKDKVNNKVVYAEAGKDLIDFLFSFLTLPLGSIIKLLKKEVQLGCVNNLYNSIEILCDSQTGIMSEDCRSMLLSPMLLPHFGISNQMLRVDEMHKMPSMPSSTRLTNPKLPGGGEEPGGGFVKESGLFMLTEELEVTPFSPISVINLVNQFRIPVTDLEERVLSFGENEALNLLKVCISSGKPLTEMSFLDEH